MTHCCPTRRCSDLQPRVAERYDWLSPTVMRFIARVVKTVDGSKVALGVCGEMGGRPLEAMALLGAGIERLSITPAGVGPVNAIVGSEERRVGKEGVSRRISRGSRYH